MKIKTSKLERPALDWAVATLNGNKPHHCVDGVVWLDESEMASFQPSTDWLEHVSRYQTAEWRGLKK